MRKLDCSGSIIAWKCKKVTVKIGLKYAYIWCALYHLSQALRLTCIAVGLSLIKAKYKKKARPDF